MAQEKASPARKWTDATGSYTVVAELLEVTRDAVRLQREDGAEITVPIARLSEEDRRYVASLKEAKPKAEAEKPAPPPEVERFLTALETYRPVEIKLLESHVEYARKQCAEAKKNKEDTEAKRLHEDINSTRDRLELLNSGKVVVLELRLDHLAEGQIGRFGENYAFSVSEVIDHQTMVICPSYVSLYFTYVDHPLLGRTPTPISVVRVMSSHAFIVRGLGTAGLEPDKGAARGGSKIDALMRRQVFEVLPKEKHGHRSMFVLTPFPMEKVNKWLAKPGRLSVPR